MIFLYIFIFLIVAFFIFFLSISRFKLKVFRENMKTLWHKIQVFRFMLRVIFKLFKRAFVHDFSKFSKHEAPYFADAKKLNLLKYGSIEYKKCLAETLKPALDHHYKNNSHHPEYHSGGINQMSLLDQIEMLCDWKAATLRTKDGDIKKSIQINKDRFGYSEDTKKKYEQFLRDINALD